MNTNGFIPAFPTWVKDDAMMPGMNLRDYFAAQAMQGLISATAWHPDFVYPDTSEHDAGNRADVSVSNAAYKYADAMLKARQK